MHEVMCTTPGHIQRILTRLRLPSPLDQILPIDGPSRTPGRPIVWFARCTSSSRETPGVCWLDDEAPLPLSADDAVEIDATVGADLDHERRSVMQAHPDHHCFTPRYRSSDATPEQAHERATGYLWRPPLLATMPTEEIVAVVDAWPYLTNAVDRKAIVQANMSHLQRAFSMAAVHQYRAPYTHAMALLSLITAQKTAVSAAILRAGPPRLIALLDRHDGTEAEHDVLVDALIGTPAIDVLAHDDLAETWDRLTPSQRTRIALASAIAGSRNPRILQTLGDPASAADHMAQATTTA